MKTKRYFSTTIALVALLGLAGCSQAPAAQKPARVPAAPAPKPQPVQPAGEQAPLDEPVLPPPSDLPPEPPAPPSGAVE